MSHGLNQGIKPNKVAANPAIALRLQSTPLMGQVAKLQKLSITFYEEDQIIEFGFATFVDGWLQPLPINNIGTPDSLRSRGLFCIAVPA